MTPENSMRTPPAEGLIRRTFRRRWIAILTQGLILSVALVAAVYVVVQPTYRATSLIRVESTSGLLEPEPKQDFDQIMETQVQLLTSPNVLGGAANDPKVAVLPWIMGATDPVAELRKVVHVAIRPKTFLIEVSTTSESAFEAATIVNAVVDVYMESAVEWSNGMVRNQITALEKYASDLANQSADLERKWKTLAARQGVEGGAVRPGVMNADHARLVQARWAENDIKRMEIEARLEALRARKDDDARRMVAELETDLEAANILERTLKARLTPSGDESRAQVNTEVDLVLVKESHESLNAMRESVRRRLEKLKFESSSGNEAIRPINVAVPPTRPVSDPRLAIMAVVPFASFALAFAFFAGIEAWSTGRGLKVAASAEV